MIAAYQRISRADGDLGKDGKDKSNSIFSAMRVFHSAGMGGLDVERFYPCR